MGETKPFDWELFLEICKKYNVLLSKEYKTPMIKLENGNVIPLSELGVKEDCHKEVTKFLYDNKKHYHFLFDIDKSYVYEE